MYWAKIYFQVYMYYAFLHLCSAQTYTEGKKKNPTDALSGASLHLYSVNFFYLLSTKRSVFSLSMFVIIFLAERVSFTEKLHRSKCNQTEIVPSWVWFRVLELQVCFGII